VTDYFVAVSVGDQSIGRVLIDPRELADPNAQELITRKLTDAIAEWRGKPPGPEENGEPEPDRG
jgi:hypothetical protein